MKSIHLVLFAAALAIISSSCHKREHWPVRGKGDVVTTTRDLSGFSRIHLSCDADISYTQDSVYRVEVTGQPNILAVLETGVSGGELRVGIDRNVWEHKPIKLVVHSPGMNGITITGSGNVFSDREVKTSDIELNISGSGNIRLMSLQANSLSGKISGSGDIEVLGGSSGTTLYTISGSGNINAEFHGCVSSSASISGSGNISLKVSESLKVRISGSGDVSYTGKPSIDAEISGSGKLRAI